MQSNPISTAKSIETMTDEFAVLDPYTATAPLLANAMLANLKQNKPEYSKRYANSREQMLNALVKLDAKPEEYPDWMRNYDFKAWMWGVVTFAADH